jgi:rod shape-determining protein MreB and related proteins
LNPYFTIIEDQILETLEQAGSHQRINQIISNGFYFTGGGAYVKWLIEKIALNGKMKTTSSPDPLLDNINGLKKVIKSPDNFKAYLMV